MILNKEYFKNKLMEEKKLIEKELDIIGSYDEEKKDWEAVSKIEVAEIDPNSVANKFEALEENSATLNELEAKLFEINIALEKIKNDSYGICETCKNQIEVDRLEANPSAKVCIEHLE